MVIDHLYLPSHNQVQPGFTTGKIFEYFIIYCFHFIQLCIVLTTKKEFKVDYFSQNQH